MYLRPLSGPIGLDSQPVLAGQPENDPYTWGLNPHLNHQTVTPGFFATMRMTVERGRGFLESDTIQSPGVVIVSRSAAERLWPGRDPLRKLLEALLTPQIELTWSKRRIMEVYLNVAETGPGLYGAEAAARAYFGKPAEALTRREAALIAAVLPDPRAWSPARPTRYIRSRAATIERRIGQLGPLLDCVE